MNGNVGKMAAIARTSARRAAGDRRFFFVIAVLPVGVMLLVGTVFGGGNTRLPIGVIDRDHTTLSQALSDDIANSERVKRRTYHSVESMRNDIRRGRILGGITIDEGYDRALRRGGGAEIDIIGAPGRTDGIEARVGVEASVRRQSTVVVAARLAVARGDDFDAAWTHADRVASRLEDSHRSDDVRSPFSYTAPSNLVLFVFIGSLATAVGLVSARELGVTRRMLSTPTPPIVLLLGTSVAALVNALAQSAMLMVVGATLFGVHWGDPIAMLLVATLFAIVSTAAGLLVGSTARSSEQAISMAPGIGIALGMLGGCMWALDTVGSVMRQVGHITPHAWAMDAWVTLILHDGTLRDVLGDIAVLAGFAIVLVTVAAIRLRQSVTRAA